MELASYHYSGRGSFAEINRAGRVAGHSFISTAKVVNEWGYASAPSKYLYGVNRVKFYVCKGEAVGNVRVVDASRENRNGDIYNIRRLRQNVRLIKIIHQKLLVVNPLLQRARCQSLIPRHASDCALVGVSVCYILH